MPFSIFKPIIKLTRSPIANIKKWLFEKDKIIIPNLLKPHKTETVKEKTINCEKLRIVILQIVNKLDELIDRVNNDSLELINRVQLLEEQKSKRGHGHQFAGTGAVLPSTARKGGSVRKMRKGGKFTKPVVTSIEDFKQKLIDDIKQLQENSDG